MEDEDDVDIVGEFDEVVLTPSTCSTYDEMGLNINEFLPYFGSNSWLLNTDQVWNLDSNTDDKSKACIEKILQEDRETTHFLPNVSKISTNLISSSHKKPWTETEKDLFHQGLKTFGHSWTKISKFIGTRTTLQVKNFARQYLKQAERNVSTNQVGEPEGISPISLSLPENAFETGSPTVSCVEMKSPRKKSPADFDSGKSLLKTKKLKIVPSNEIVRIDKESTSSDAEDIDIEDLGDVPLQSSPKRRFVITENVLHHEKHLELGTTEGHLSDEGQLTGTIAESGEEQVQTFPDNCPIEDYESKVTKQELNIFVNETKSASDIQEINYGSGESDDENVTRLLDESQVFKKSYDFDIPTDELMLERNTITDLEKTVHQEFFEGRSQKTPERYLKIRNYILDSWEKSKPTYLNKTSVRPGLKNCGDVNCIGRIHTYLEQVGAINFGCDQTVYSRPLVLLGRPIAIAKKLNQGSSLVHQFARMETMRPRKRKIPFFTYDSVAGGYTIEHGKDGEVIDVAERLDIAPPAHKRTKAGDDPFRLIFCAEFNSDKPPPFPVAVHLEALLVMDVHAHLSALEVIGLLGGHFDQEHNTLHIVSAEPCESLSTGLECEMDPVSQTLASEKLHGEGYSVVGWYHSHPTFAPNPSVRDLETQAKFQEWFSQGGAPFLGVIITPHLCGSPFSKLRYLIVGEEVVHPEGYRLPYKFTPDIICSNKDAGKLLSGIVKLIEKRKAGPSPSVGLKASLATLNKMLSSIHHHLSRTQMEQTAQNTILNEFGKTLVTHLISDEWTEPSADCESEREKEEESADEKRESPTVTSEIAKTI